MTKGSRCDGIDCGKWRNDTLGVFSGWITATSGLAETRHFCSFACASSYFADRLAKQEARRAD